MDFKEITTDILSSLMLSFSKMKVESEQARLSEFRKFTDLWERDLDEIEKIVFDYFRDRPFSVKTLERMPFVYDDIIQKVIGRKTAGLLAKQPSIELSQGEGETKQIFGISNFLEETRFNEVIDEAIQKAEFFNTVILQPVYRDGEINIDVITPDGCIVEPADDFLKIKEIAVARAMGDGTLYGSYWTKEEHYLMMGDEREAPEDNPNMVNPYGRLPFVVYRAKNGRDFWGEPNWALYIMQITYAMSLSDNKNAEFFTQYPVLYGVNFELPDKARLTPGELVSVNGDTTQKSISLNVVNFNVPWEQIRENVKQRIEMFYMNQGLPASSSSTETKALSGAAKEIDEKELEESRDRKRARIVRMIRELLEVTRLVWNYHKEYREKIPDGFDFTVQLNDQNERLAASELKALREMQVAYNIADPITFIMQDLELSESEAIEHYQKIQKRKTEIGAGTQTQVRRPRTLTDILNELPDANGAQNA